MSRYKLVFTKNAAKDVAKLPKPITNRIGKKLMYFADQSNPLSSAKPLKDSATADYRWRIGDYRILFDIDGNKIVILRIRHRRDVYKN